LIRLVLHGVALVDRSGERISVTSHLLRHAAATVQRQQYGVPLVILAEAMGHTLGAKGQAPEATRYYSQMTETQKTEIRHEAIVAMMDDARVAVRVIEPDEEAHRIQHLMAEADEHTRDVLERYGGLLSRDVWPLRLPRSMRSRHRSGFLHRLPVSGAPTRVHRSG
jgi:hypothetical protein